MLRSRQYITILTYVFFSSVFLFSSVNICNNCIYNKISLNLCDIFVGQVEMNLSHNMECNVQSSMITGAHYNLKTILFRSSHEFVKEFKKKKIIFNIRRYFNNVFLERKINQLKISKKVYFLIAPIEMKSNYYWRRLILKTNLNRLKHIQ